jgi:hypothetical protein
MGRGAGTIIDQSSLSFMSESELQVDPRLAIKLKK